MSTPWRIGIGAAAAVVAILLFVLLRPGDEEPARVAETTTEETTTAAGTTTGEAETTTEGTTTEAEPAAFRIDVPASGPGRVERLTVRRGDDVELVVTLPFHDDIHIHGYDLLLHTGPGLPAARFRFVADTPGRFEIESELAGVQIAELRVRP